MRLHARNRLVLALTVLGTVACPEPNPFEPDPQYTLSIVSGDDQVVSAGTALEPLSVLVADLDGVPLDGAYVVWSVKEGGGLFRVPVGGGWGLVNAYANQTGRDGPGRADVGFMVTEIGTTTVTAFATRDHGNLVGSVEFLARADAVAIVLDRASAEWASDWPTGVENVSVELGTTVEWHRTDPWGEDRVRSVTVPVGGVRFEGMEDDSVFAFEPEASGVWTWEWERWEADPEGWQWWPARLTDTLTLVVR